MIKKSSALLCTAIIALTAPHTANAEMAISEDNAKGFIEEHVASWINDSTILDAIKAQNTKNADLNEEQIIALDNKWRADDQELISTTTGNALSTFLKEKQEASEGLFTEIFVMDNKGLNVGQSALTSDYWQGDEAKWKDTYSAGHAKIHVSEVEFDESSQSYQVQISTTISDGETPIGAVTFGVDAEMIE